MRLSMIWTIFRKELRDSLRDRRTLVMMVGLPILLYPLLILGAAKLQSSQAESSEARVSGIAVWGDITTDLRDLLEADDDISLVAVAPPSETVPYPGDEDEMPADLIDRARAVVLGRDADAVLLSWEGSRLAIDAEESGQLSVFYDSVRADSRKARERLADLIEDYRETVLSRRVSRRDLPEDFARPVDLHSRDVAGGERRFAGMFGSVLGFILVFVTALGGFYAAIDLTAGEKERGTMQTLMCAPVRPAEIAGGKFLAVWTISLIASGANVASMGLAFSRLAADFTGITMTPGAYLLALLFLAPVSMLLSALSLAVAAFARDFKDGQNYLTPLLLVLVFPLMVTAMPSVELNSYTAFVPIANISLLIKAVFLAEARPDAIFLTMLSSCVYAGLGVMAAAKVFERETVLLGGSTSIREMFRIERHPGKTPSPSMAFVFYAVLLTAAFYLGLFLTDAGMIKMILVVQYGIFLLPAVAVSALMGYAPLKTFSLRGIGWRGLVGAVILGASAWTFATGVLVRLLPPPESLVRALERILLIEDQSIPLVIALLVVAVTPAICEELVFRGFILSGLRPYGMWAAIGVTGLLFGLAHASIYRLMPTAFLGIVMGYAVWKTRSIVAGMIIHALTNGLMVTLARSEATVTALGLNGATMLPWGYTLGGSAVMVIGLLLIRGIKDPIRTG